MARNKTGHGEDYCSEKWCHGINGIGTICGKKEQPLKETPKQKELKRLYGPSEIFKAHNPKISHHSKLDKPDYSFQDELVNRSFYHMKKDGGVVLAASCGGGKTIMSIKLMEKDIKDPASEGVTLVLTHGQSVLRKQMTQELEKSQSLQGKSLERFTFREVYGSIEELGPEQVIIALPHAFMNKMPKGKVKTLVIDEGHHYFYGDMVQAIIKHYKPKRILILTGTPSPFIRSKEFPIVSMPVGELLDHNVISDAQIELVESAYKYKTSDFNNEHDLKQNVFFKSDETKKSLDNVFNYLDKKVQGKLGKTFIACKDQDQARQVFGYLCKKGIQTALSTSDTDKESTQIDRFQEDPECTVLVVVNRGVLGFNMPELQNVVDMTGSHNIDRIFQLMARVIRKHPDVKEKNFIKLTNKENYDRSYFFTSATVGLSQRELYEKFDGSINSLLGVEISSPREYCERIKTASSGGEKTVAKIEPFSLPPILTFKQIKTKDFCSRQNRVIER